MPIEILYQSWTSGIKGQLTNYRLYYTGNSDYYLTNTCSQRTDAQTMFEIRLDCYFIFILMFL